MKKLTTSTTKDGNLSFKWGEHDEVLNNRKTFLSKNNVRLEDCVALKTQDGDTIEIVDHTFKGRGMTDAETGVQADALVTKEKDLFLFLLTADCLPICFHDPHKNVIGLAHLSWKTTDAHLVQKVVNVFVNSFGCKADDIQVTIGPGIHKASYILPDIAQQDDGGWKPYITKTTTGQFSIDILGYNHHQLLEKGVVPQNITTSEQDTCASPTYFSHYRSTRTGEPEGRFATVAGLKNNL